MYVLDANDPKTVKPKSNTAIGIKPSNGNHAAKTGANDKK